MPKKVTQPEESKHKLRLSQQTDDEVQVFSGSVTLANGIKHDQRAVVRKINNHKAGKFANLEDENAIFWALGQQRAVHFAKKLDIDTRHFQVEGYGDFNYYQAWATNIRFRKWAKDTGFSLDLDDFGDALADFGSVPLKLVERKEGGFDLKEVNLMYIWFDPTIKEFKGQTKIELHELEKHTVLDKEGWNNASESWKQAETIGDNNEENEKSDETDTVAEKRKYWERVGYFNIALYKDGDLENGEYIQKPEKEDWQFMHTIHAGEGESEVIVFAEEIKEDEDIYMDLHISKYEDRWLRIGVYERLFPQQKYANEVVNYNKQSQQISSLLIMFSKSKSLVGSNLFKKAKSGMITNKKMEQMKIDNQFFGEFINTLASIEQKADQLTMIPDVLTGEGSEKTFRGLAAKINQANSAFKKARDRISFRISKILIDRILPEEMKDWNKEKSLEIAGFDIDTQIYDALKVIQDLEKFVSRIHKTGRNPSEEEKQIETQRIQRQIETEGRKAKIGEKFYDFDFGLSMNPTGENENKEQKNDAYFNIVNWILNSQGAVTTIPAFREYVEINGVTPFHLTQQQIEQLQQAGGQTQPIGEKRDKLSAAIETTI